MDVSDVIRDRGQEVAGLQRMVALSIAVHAVALAIVIAAPGRWFSQHGAPPLTVMTITLGGGTPGPQNGGMTNIGGRPVQAETPADAPKRPEAIRPPAAATPEMTLPTKGRASRTSPTAVRETTPDARGRTPTRGEKVAAGSAVAETGVRGQGFGLSTGGGGAGGVGVRLDVGNFCCPDYLVTMTQRVQTNWNPHADNPGQAIVKFTIQRDGTITNVELEESSGYTALNLAALRALTATRQLPPLPAAYSNPNLTIHLTFQFTQ